MSIRSDDHSPLTKKRTTDTCLPLMKWAGGKRRLLPFILPYIHQTGGRYFEPFVGGGAVFFAVDAKRAVIGDANPDVTNCYEQVKTNLDVLIARLSAFKNSERDYYRIREWEPSGSLDRAARMLYLTRFSFNGIYRQNQEGKFNVPYGYKTHLTVFDEQHLRRIGSKLKKATIRLGDFAVTVADARAGDTVYFDPPYTVAHGNNGFVKYNARIFSWEDQHRLADLAKKLISKGCSVAVSNADHSSIDELYSGFRKLRIARPSVIAASSQHRRVTSEALFVGRADAWLSL